MESRKRKGICLCRLTNTAANSVAISPKCRPRLPKKRRASTLPAHSAEVKTSPRSLAVSFWDAHQKVDGAEATVGAVPVARKHDPGAGLPYVRHQDFPPTARKKSTKKIPPEPRLFWRETLLIPLKVTVHPSRDSAGTPLCHNTRDRVHSWGVSHNQDNFSNQSPYSGDTDRSRYSNCRAVDRNFSMNPRALFHPQSNFLSS